MFGIPLMALAAVLVIGVGIGFIVSAVLTAGKIDDIRMQMNRLRSELNHEIRAHDETRARLVRLTDRDERGLEDGEGDVELAAQLAALVPEVVHAALVGLARRRDGLGLGLRCGDGHEDPRLARAVVGEHAHGGSLGVRHRPPPAGGTRIDSDDESTHRPHSRTRSMIRSP